MSQVTRWAPPGSRIRVPADIPESARWVLDQFVSDPGSYWGDDYQTDRGRS